MNRRPRRQFWIETGLAALSAALLVLTLLLPDWIEALFHFDPDRHSGSLEAAIVGGLAVTTVVSSILARREWRRSGVERLRSA
jgi:hypothetical protein